MDCLELDDKLYLHGTPRSVQRLHSGCVPLHLTLDARHAAHAVGGRRARGLPFRRCAACQLIMKSRGILFLPEWRGLLECDMISYCAVDDGMGQETRMIY